MMLDSYGGVTEAVRTTDTLGSKLRVGMDTGLSANTTAEISEFFDVLTKSKVDKVAVWHYGGTGGATRTASQRPEEPGPIRRWQ